MRRRQLILCVVALSTSLTIGLAVTRTRSLHVFETLTYFIGLVSVTPQILLPLAADLAPEEKRATAISVCSLRTIFWYLASSSFGWDRR